MKALSGPIAVLIVAITVVASLLWQPARAQQDDGGKSWEYMYVGGKTEGNANDELWREFSHSPQILVCDRVKRTGMPSRLR